MPPQTRTRGQNFVLIVSLGILNALTPFTIDLYLPSFPHIAADLGVEIGRIALTVSIYFIGFSFGQIIYGPLLDRFGRKPPLYVGLFIYIVASMGCATAESLNSLMVFRLLTALGGCSVSVGAMTMVRDYFPPEASAKIFSMLMLVLGTSPLFAPSVGSYMIGFTGWRTIFWVLACWGVIDMFIVGSLPPGYTADPTVQLHPRPMLKKIKTVLTNGQFMTAVLAGSFSFAGLFVYVAASPAIFMDYFRVTPKFYGAIFALLAVGMICGGQLNHVLVETWGSRKTFRVAIFVQAAVSLVFFVGGLFGAFGIAATLCCLFVLLGSAGLSYPNAAALALEPFNTDIGTASSLLGFLQLGVGAVVSAGVGLWPTRGYLPTATAIFISSCIAVLVLLVSKHGKPQPVSDL